MLLIADLIRRSPVIFALISALDNLVVVAGCAFFSIPLFHLSVRKKALPLLCAFFLCSACGAVLPLTTTASDFIQMLWAAADLAMPFLCMLLIFERRGRAKAMLTVIGYALVEALRFLILLLFYDFDNDHRDDALELIVGFVVDVVVFLLAGLLLTWYARRRVLTVNVTRDGSALFVLFASSAAVFIMSLLLVASSYSETRKTEFAFMLLNLPLLTATVSFAAVRLFRIRAESDKYKNQLQMQIHQFEWMEQMVEDVRMFRHDFPKKMRPLIAYLDDDRTEEARGIAEQFSDFVAQTGERFHTGNYRMDTVLFCEQQIALRAGVRLDVPFDTVFPKDGVDPDDVYTIFPNALDNAIEAAAQTDADKVVSLRTHLTKQTVYVTIRNPYPGTVKVRGGLPQTQKADRTAHGYGFRSMQKAAAKYGTDNVTFTAENGVFELRIFLNLKIEEHSTPSK